MKIKLIIIFISLLIFSCKEEKRNNHKEVMSTSNKNTIKVKKTIIKNVEDVIKDKNEKLDCNKYWRSIYPHDTVKTKLIKEIILQNKDFLTENNLKFLQSLASEDKTDLAINNTLFPIFRLSENEIGIFTNANSKSEVELIGKFDTIKKDVEENIGELVFYPKLLNYVFNGISRPNFKYYSTGSKGVIKINELGVFIDACLEYFEYSIDTTEVTMNNNLLFGSKFDIDLVYENIPFIDTLIQNNYDPRCYDCPNNIKQQKTFARLEGTNNLYFVYADTFPINNELYEPSRALILVSDNKIIYLWYASIDLAGCNCL